MNNAGYRSKILNCRFNLRQERFPVGTRGKAMGDLRPAGTVRIGGDRIDAVSEGSFISRGTDVTIIAWTAGHPVVRAIEDQDETEAQP